VINGIAAGVNVIGDLVLVAVFHTGVVAPAIATSSSLVILFGGFYASARNVLRVKAPLPAVVVAPLVAGVVPALVLTGATEIIVGVGAALAATGAVCMWRPPFRRDDVALIAKVRLPDIIRRTLVKVLTLLAARARD
jgi:hypothetical protein